MPSHKEDPIRKYSHAMIIGSLITVLCLSLAGSQVSAAPLSAGPVGTAFTYQGQLKDGSGNPITATCDFQFSLYDALTSGGQIGTTQEVDSVSVANGYFTVNLDFGSGAFEGHARWLQIAVKCPPDSGFTTLSPLQPLTPAPYSLYALNAGLLNNLPYTSFQQHYQNLVVVAKSGGDFTTITDALASITTNDQDHRFLIFVAPGTYAETFAMKPHVDIEGAGELATKITYTGSASETTGTVIGADNAELRFLTVENTGGSAYAVAIYNSAASPCLTHITATASGATNESIGVYNTSSSPTMMDVTATASGGTYNRGVRNIASSSPTMTNVTATASGGTYAYGVSNGSSSPTMTNVTATASGGTYNYGVGNAVSSSPVMTNVTASASGGAYNNGVANFSSSPTIQFSVIGASNGSSCGIFNWAASGSYTVKVNNSRITAAGNTIYNDPSFTTQVGASELGGGGSANANGGILTCVFTYNDDFAPLGADCQNP